jgi:amidase
MARQVGDVAIMFDAIAGNDPKDPTTLREPAPNAYADIARGVDGLRVGIDREYALAGVDRGEATSIEEALQVLTSLGARIVDVHMPDLAGLAEAWLVLCSSEAAAAHAANYPSRASEYGRYFREVLQIGTEVTAQQLAAARMRRAQISAEFRALLDSMDALACPSGGAPAWPISKEIQVGSMAAYHEAWAAASPRSTDFTMPMNLAGTPAICLPSGFSGEGLPYSIQFAGRHLSEPVLCRIAHAYEQVTRWHVRHPNADTGSLTENQDTA